VTLRLALVRHGQTPSNAVRILDTVLPGAPLDDLGRAQAEALATVLADKDVVAVYASPAARTQQTAAPIAAQHGLQVEVLDGLREVNVGHLEGTTGDEPYAEYERYFTRWAGGEPTIRIPDGESAQDVLDRYLPAVDLITSRHDSGLVVVVSHGGVIRIAALALAANVTPTIAIEGGLPNTGQVVLEAEQATASRGLVWHCIAWTGITPESLD
jgi:broad specificity phosphatase PhoE